MWDHIARIALNDLAPPGLVLVIAPHPDDETLGCGGLIALSKQAGRAVLVVVLTDGAASHTGSASHSTEQMAALRADELARATAMLGLGPYEVASLSLPDGRLEEEDAGEVADRIRLDIANRSVGAIFAPGQDDPHPDHRAAARIAAALAQGYNALLWDYPVRAHVIDAVLKASTDLVRLDISGVLARKRAALACHASQLGDLVKDDPNGFQLSQVDVSQHACGWELYRRSDRRA